MEAIRLLRDAWGSPAARNLEQIEIIDIGQEDVIRERWAGFIHSHHWEQHKSYFESQLALFPRRTVECYMRQFRPETPEEALMDERNLVPMEFANLEEAWRWFEPLIQDEDSGQLLLD